MTTSSPAVRRASERTDAAARGTHGGTHSAHCTTRHDNRETDSWTERSRSSSTRSRTHHGRSSPERCGRFTFPHSKKPRRQR
ncbi:hypothetical protein RHA1_ro05286 [Rhodococcus jostii RHA1]|uniref:Uncharacterized protein n=1 Tax=Rhodococcus jostii (strain RHA1) TaxID=101510 RepID=Q0S5W9_RHOJR|nr:hypothetical protein RHA1_ro05286 [Rhodococcus jostii RHA1]